MNKKEELKEYYLNNIEEYEKWGNIVKSKIEELLKNDDINEPELQWISKVRVKKLESFIEKALYRENKSYDDPIHEIEDYVGLRVIVLFKKTCSEINKLLKRPGWHITKARDFEEEIKKEPMIFDYQSNHYIIRPIEGIFEGHNFSVDVCCELQVRTLMQHAYAEVTHDLLYKGITSIRLETKRNTIRGMALSETTDFLFQQVESEIKSDIKCQSKIISKLTDFINKHKLTLNTDFIALQKQYNNVSEIISVEDSSKFEDFIDDFENYLVEDSKELAVDHDNSAIVVFYQYLVKTKKRQLEEIWSKDLELLKKIENKINYWNII